MFAQRHPAQRHPAQEIFTQGIATVKLQGKAIDGFLARPDPRVRAVLVYGPDQGLVRERADRLGRTVIEDLADPFRVTELPARVAATDLARLVDEVAARSMTGGRRLVRLPEADDSHAPAFAHLFDTLPPGDTLVVAEAGELGPRSRLRQLFEGAAFGAVECGEVTSGPPSARLPVADRFIRSRPSITRLTRSRPPVR